MAEITKQGTFKLNFFQLFTPFLIGLIVIIWMFFNEFESVSFQNVLNLSWQSAGFLALAVLFMAGRDLGIICRFKLLTGHLIGWKQAFQIHILTEFTSAVTPSAVGGSGLTVLFMKKAGVGLGKSTTIMFVNLFLDELFFVLAFPVIWLLVPVDELFINTNLLSSTFVLLFKIIYSIIFLWTVLLYLFLFVKPTWTPKIVKFIFRLSFLKKWYPKIEQFAESLIISSVEVKNQTMVFWLKAFGATVLSWVSRFLVVNALFLIFIPVSNHLIIFGRQILLWILMIISPTPGGAGLSEIAFKEYYNDLMIDGGQVLLIILSWRIITYYLYLLLGAITIPSWIKKSF